MVDIRLSWPPVGRSSANLTGRRVDSSLTRRAVVRHSADSAGYRSTVRCSIEGRPTGLHNSSLVVLQVEATDADEGTNGALLYSIVSGDSEDAFRVESLSGEVTVAKDIDRERVPEYRLGVQAEDGGTFTNGLRAIHGRG